MWILTLALLCACGSEYGLVPQHDVSEYVVHDIDTAENVMLVEDIYLTETREQTDILFVVDNSCSMMNKQEYLADNFFFLKDQLLALDLDYHIGVTTTDPLDEGRLEYISGTTDKWIDVDTPDAATKFYDTVLLGVDGGGPETTFYPTQASVTQHGWDWNYGFMRPEATFHVIAVSDEEDQSSLTVTEFVTWMQALKGSPDAVSYSIIGYTLDGSSKGARAASLLGGEAMPINGPWDATLREIASRASEATYIYSLSRVPLDPSQMEVTVLASENTYVYRYSPCDDFCYTYDPIGNRVRLGRGYILRGGEVVRILYEAYL